MILFSCLSDKIMNISVSNIQPKMHGIKCCILCIQEYPYDSVNLVSVTEEALQIENKIFESTQVILNFRKLIPYALCSNCLTELNVAYEFRIKCLTAVSRDLDPKKPILYDQATFIKDECLDGLDSSCSDSLPANEINAISSKDENSKICNPRNRRKGIETKKQQQYQCSVCLYITNRKQTLVTHLRIHNGERPFKCKCGKSFAQRASYSNHLVSHSNTRKHTCSLCSKEFKLMAALKRHLNCHAEGSYSCKICSKKLKSKETLDIHLNRHAKVYRYHCEICGDKFFSSAELANHKIKHKKQVIYLQCDVCGYKTITKKVLKVHVIRHLGIKSYQCALCPYSSYTSGELRVHERVHTHKKQFPCGICKQKFMHSNSVTRHVRVVHGKL